MKDSSEPVIAVTGANGFIGWALCKRLIAQGNRVRTLVRYRSTSPDEFQFDLATGIIDPAALEGPVRAIVHCAWDIKTQELSESQHINVDGTQRLIDRCQQAGAEQFVFVSSMAAHAGAHSVYGKTKWETENRLLSLPNADTFSTVIAPGTVIGKGGVFAQARATVKRLPVIPIFYGFSHRRLQTILVDDLCDAIALSITKKVTGRLCIAEPDGVPLRQFYQGLAALEHRSPLMFPFPGDLALIAIRLLESVGLKPPVSSSNLMGIRQLQNCDTIHSIQLLGCPPMTTYLQSLQRMAIEEGAPDVAAHIANLSTKELT